MGCSGPSKPWERSLHVQERLSVVLAGWGYSSYSQCDPGVAQSAIPTNIGQSTLRSWAEIQIGLHIHLTWSPPPRLLLIEVLEGLCIWEQVQDNPWTILLAVFKYASSGAVDIWSTYYNVLWKQSRPSKICRNVIFQNCYGLKFPWLSCFCFYGVRL